MARIPKYTDMGWPEQDALWTYNSLTEPLLSSELSRLSLAQSYGNTDCVSLQPCPDPEAKNQDRYSILDWKLKDGIWRFRAVFDGHAGHDTVDYILNSLPPIIEVALTDLVEKVGDNTLDPHSVSTLLVEAIALLDNTMTQDLLRLFPTPAVISALSDVEIDSIINDGKSGGVNSAIITRCMRGSTVLVSLLDPGEENLWVASLGDCQSVLARKRCNGDWEGLRLSSYHNGTEKTEKERIMKEHPGEMECVLDDRVLGAIAVTRAIGDHLFKLPAIYTNRIFMRKTPGFSISRKIDEFLGRNLTPPYISNRADIQHVALKSSEATDSFLVMFSDGLIDLYEEKDLDLDALAGYCAQVVGNAVGQGTRPCNLASSLLRDALGGTDEEKISRMLTVEMSCRWMDDTTIIVHKISD
ncbi:protein serine threonine phosphatase 2C [Collybia nuda]|uniref:Protein serine threonine phosphatase 2C n=1 Tax=Collybia nuda TaxID=64659 RepID=A0A9P5XZA0_9AGAR|nr:protein serine threonine phosphatase 2C [Collybia nuda]